MFMIRKLPVILRLGKPDLYVSTGVGNALDVVGDYETISEHVKCLPN